MMIRVRWAGLWLLTALWLVPAHAAVIAHVDRVVVPEGESLTLVIESGSDQEPDLQPLQKDFDVLGTSNSKQIQFINGQVSSRSSWNVQLSPKHDGRLVIPALTVGDEQTAPINIEVTKAGKGAIVSGAEDLFLEVDAEPKEVYVREQVVLTVKFFQAIDIRDGSLSKPELDNAVVEKLGEDRVTEEMRDGVSYRVVHRKFAIFPQSSGKLTIPAVVFDGQMMVANRGRRAYGGFDPFDRFLQQTRPVRLRSDPLAITVLPQPATVTADWWLPVQQLSLNETWTPDPPVFKVGEPVTRSLRLEATGTVESQLPDIKAADSDNIKIYPDQPVSTLSGNGETLLASKEIKMAMIPTAAGTFTLPEIRIPWWNTRLRRMEVARIAPREITVEGGVAAPVAPAAGTALTTQTVAAAQDAAATAAPMLMASGSEASNWVSVAMLALWFATLGGWWWDRRRYRRSATVVPVNAGKPDARLSRVSQQFERACDIGDARQAAAGVVRLAQLVNGDERLKNLGQITCLFADAEVVKELERLEQHLYGHDTGTWDGNAFKARMLPAVHQLSQQVADRRAVQSRQSLPELYASG